MHRSNRPESVKMSESATNRPAETRDDPTCCQTIEGAIFCCRFFYTVATMSAEDHRRVQRGLNNFAEGIEATGKLLESAGKLANQVNDIYTACKNVNEYIATHPRPRYRK